MPIKSKYLLVSDLHIHNYKNHAKWVDGVNSRMLDCLNALDAAFEIGKEQGCNAAIIAGDIFHVRGYIRPSVFAKVYDRITKYSQMMPVFMVSGNHDLESFSAAESALYALGGVKGCYGSHILDGSTHTNLQGDLMAGIPYTHDIGEFKEKLYANKGANVIICHQGVDEFRPTANIPETSLTVDAFEGVADLIVCGHYHIPKKRIVGMNTVISPGAPLQHHFGDEGQERGCWVVSNEGAEFFALHCTPKFKTYTMHDAVQPNSQGEFGGHIIRLRGDDSYQLNQIKQTILDYGAHDVVVDLDKEFTTTHEKQLTIGSARSMLVEYIDMMDKYKSHKQELLNEFDKLDGGAYE